MNPNGVTTTLVFVLWAFNRSHRIGRVDHVLKTHKGFREGMPTTNADQINADLLEVPKQEAAPPTESYIKRQGLILESCGKDQMGSPLPDEALPRRVNFFFPGIRIMKTILTACTVFAFASVVCAGDESGPKAGEKVPELMAYGVVGLVEGKEADFAKERKDAPTIFIFVQAMEGGVPTGGRPAARFMKELDKNIGGTSDKAAIVAVWLGEKAFDKHKEYLPRIQKSLNFEKTSLAAFNGERSGPNNWGVNPDVHLTVVIVNKDKVVKSLAFRSVNETDAKPVLEILKKALN